MLKETTKLREDLKNRGVTYEVNDKDFMRITSWEFEDSMFATFVEYYDGTTEFYMDCRYFTYEKALDVTLG